MSEWKDEKTTTIPGEEQEENKEFKKEEKTQVEEITDEDYEWLKKAALIGGVFILGIIFGKSRSRYKRLKKGFSITPPPSFTDRDIAAVDWFVHEQNLEWAKRHLALVIDKKRK